MKKPLINQAHSKSLLNMEEMKEFSTAILGAIQALPDMPEKQDLIAQAQELQRLVNKLAPLKAIRVQTGALSTGLRSVLPVALVPSRMPDIAMGKTLYQANCTACMETTGKGDGELAATLEPAPTNFRDANRMDQLSIFALYNTVTLGVEGTGMVSYAKTLTDAERWNLAFYISTLVDSPKTSQCRQNGMGIG